MPKRKKPIFGGSRAVIYRRVSTQEQVKDGHYGLKLQSEACSAYCSMRGYGVIKETEDLGISGAKEINRRPGLQEALQLCEAGEADLIVVYAQDRLARKSGIFDEIRDRARKHGYRIETKDGQDLIAEDYEIAGDAMAFVANVERKMIARRLYGGRKERSKIDGLGSGPLPYGFQLLPQGGIVIDEPAAYGVRKVLSLREKYTLKETAQMLNKLRIASPLGGLWTFAKVQTIEKHRRLYETGQRTWDAIEALKPWPIIYQQGRH